MAASVRAVLTAALLASGAGAASPDPNKKPTFAYPQLGSSKVFNTMDTVIVTYTSFYDTAVLYTFCQPGIGSLIYQQKAPGFTANVPVVLNFTSATPCWFNVRTGVDGIDSENSATFNLIGEERSSGRQVFGLGLDPSTSSTVSSVSSTTKASSPSSSSSSSTTTSSPSTTGASGSSSSSSSNSNPAETTPPASSGSSSLSAGASAGIGVGAALGVLSLAAGLAYLFWRRRKQQRQQHGRAAEVELDGGGNNTAPPYGGYSGYGGYGGGGGHGYGGVENIPASELGRYSQQKWPRIGELNSLHTPVEIGTSAVSPASGVGAAGRAHHEM